MNKKKGFTLAELLIVVAIIAVLVGVAIPVFTRQMEKAKESTDMANIRSCYATATTGYLADGTEVTPITEGKMQCSVAYPVAGATDPQITVTVVSGNQSTKFGTGATYDGKTFKDKDGNAVP